MMTHLEAIKHKLSEYGDGLFEFETSEIGAAINELEKELEAVKAENKRNYDKWWDMEQEYILPLFRIAKEMGFDLQKLVINNAGKNCSIIFAEHLQAELKAMKEKAKWINVKDRLPHSGRHVLGLLKTSAGTVVWHEEVYYSNDKYGFCTSFADCVQDEDAEVTHWMPLPEAPDNQEG